MVQLYCQKEQNMVMQFNAAHASFRERKKSNGPKTKGEEEDHDVV
jgi:hypothetical protein